MDRPPPRPSALLAGLGAGLALALADWCASGIGPTPALLALATLIGGGLAGSLAGAIAGALRKPALGPGLVLAMAVGLEGLSRASKELAGAQRVAAALLVAAAALAAALALWRVHAGPRRGGWAHVGALASVPAGAWLGARLSSEPWVHVAAVAAPLAWLLAVRLTRRSRPLRIGAWLALSIPLVWAQIGHAPRAALPERPAPSSAQSAQSERPSIVLLVLDTLRADATDPHGPLAAFAREGVEFRQCTSSAPWTLPSVSSLLTGLYPSQHGALTPTTPLAEDVTTLAELLRAAGYATAAFTGGAFVGAGHRLDQGFHVFDASCERRFPAFVLHTPLVWRLAKNRYLPLRWLVRAVDESVGLAGVLAAAHAWAASEEHAPKFLFLHTYQVHDYYIYDADLDDEVLANGPGPSARFAGRLSVHPSELALASEADIEHFHALYRGRVRTVERLFPELVRALTSDLGPGAIWIVTADHGEGFEAASGRVHHGGRLHEDLLHVPLLIRAPGRLAPGQRVEDGVRTIDVLPTVLELAGVPIPPGLAGESLIPALRGERAFPASAFAEDRAHGHDLLALRRGGWKWIQARGEAEFYHLAEDAHERFPLSVEPPADLREELSAFATRYPARAVVEVQLDSATLEQLRALGYVR